MSLTPLNYALIGVLGLIGVGFYAMLVVRNLIKIVVALQILVKGAVLALVAAAAAGGQVNLGQSIGVTVIVADTVVAVVGLALAVQVKRQFGTLDLDALSTLKG